MIEPTDFHVPPSIAVFVDETGRKRLRARRIGWAVAVVVGLYFVLLGASVARAPWVPHLTLPGVGNVLPTPGPKLSPALGPGAVVVVTPAPDVNSPAQAPNTTATSPTSVAQSGPATVAPRPFTSGPPQTGSRAAM